MRGAVSWQDVTRSYAPEVTAARAKPVTGLSQRASAATTSAPASQPQARLRCRAGAADRAAADGCGAGRDEGAREPRARGPAGWAGLRRAGAAVPRTSGADRRRHGPRAGSLPPGRPAPAVPGRTRRRGCAGGAGGTPLPGSRRGGAASLGVGRDALDKAGKASSCSSRPRSRQHSLPLLPLPPTPSPRRSIWPLIAAAPPLIVGPGGAYWYFTPHQPVPPPRRSRHRL